MSDNSNNAQTPENNTGILPPEAEESANFENVNVTPPLPPAETPAAENNGPLGNVLNGVENIAAPPAAVQEENSLMLNAATKKPKKEQSAAQKKTITNQAAERQKLKEAGVAKPSVAMVATLTSMRAKDDPNYASAFANAVSGKPLNQFRTAKKKRKNTVLNTSAATTVAKTKKSRTKSIFSRNTGTGTQANNSRTSRTRNGNAQTMPRGVGTASQTNMRNRNIVNTAVMNTTVDAVLEMADSIGKQLAEMKRMVKTLKARRTAVRTRKASTASTNSLLGLPPAPAGVNTRLSPIAEASRENEFNSGNNSMFYTAH